MTADNIKTCVLDIGEMMNVVLRSAWPKLEALAVSWWLNLMCANKGLAVWDFALSDVALYQQDECGVCPGCLLMWAQSLLHSQNLTWSDGPFFFFGFFFPPTPCLYLFAHLASNQFSSIHVWCVYLALQ